MKEEDGNDDRCIPVTPHMRFKRKQVGTKFHDNSQYKSIASLNFAIDIKRRK